jgi:hypothetical protein
MGWAGDEIAVNGAGLSCEHMSANVIERFREVGVALAASVFTLEHVKAMTNAVAPLLHEGERTRPGVRQVMKRAPELERLVLTPEFLRLRDEAVGVGGRVVRAIAFDKTAATNWMVPWHQDATIAVKERVDVAGFGPWAVKDGDVHCQPPRDVLESIVTLRIHLDDCPHEAGSLRVMAGSHRGGLMDEREIAALVSTGTIIDTPARAGDVVVTTPLAVHSSRRSTLEGARRRVLHLDCSNIVLPGGLRWAEVA